MGLLTLGYKKFEFNKCEFSSCNTKPQLLQTFLTSEVSLETVNKVKYNTEWVPENISWDECNVSHFVLTISLTSLLLMEKWRWGVLQCIWKQIIAIKTRIL